MKQNGQHLYKGSCWALYRATSTARLRVLETDEMGVPTEAPTVRAMTAAEVEEQKTKRVPKPDVAAENATDGVAIAKLERDAPDVLKACGISPSRCCCARSPNARRDSGRRR